MSRLIAVALAVVVAGCGAENRVATPYIGSLDELSVEGLREREYGSELTIETRIPGKLYDSFMISYRSDGLRVYSRYDVPSEAAPESGYPVVIFVHGWVGVDDAPDLRFYYDEDSNYGEMIDAYVDAGFVVLTPGWRGHGTVNGVPADGIEFMQAWDNGSYLSPAFYAIDVLNLLDGLDSLDSVDPDRVHIVAHSQGGDVALIALAVAGKGSKVTNGIAAASIWSGTFPSRFTQLETYWPMQKSPEAFMSGDGTWTGTATGEDGTVNPRFVFGYPSDWIGTVNSDEWTWQSETWSEPTTLVPLRQKLEEMYAAINEYVADIDGATFELETEADGSVSITHDKRVAGAMQAIGGFDVPQYLTERLVLQHSDRDFYSLPDWNASLCRRVNAAGGTCHDFEYPGSNHSLRKSDYDWFAPADSVAGFHDALHRDIELFSGGDPREIHAP